MLSVYLISDAYGIFKKLLMFLKEDMANDLYQDSLKDNDRLLRSNPRTGSNNSSGGLSSNNFQYKNLLHSLKPKGNIANSNSKSDGPSKSTDENDGVSLKLNDTGRQIVVSPNNCKPLLEKSLSTGSNNHSSLIAENNTEKTEHIVDVGKLRSIFDKSNQSNNVQLRTAPNKRNERPYSEIYKQKEIKLTRNSSFESLVNNKQPLLRSKLDLDKILIGNASTSNNTIQDSSFDNTEHENGTLPIGASIIDVNSILAPVLQDEDQRANSFNEINVTKEASSKKYELPIENIVQLDRLKRIEKEHSVNQLTTTKRKSLKERLDDMLTEDEKIPEAKVSNLTNKLDQHEVIENLPKDNKLSWNSVNSETVQYDQGFKEDNSTSKTKQLLSNDCSHASSSEILNIRKSAVERFDEFISNEVPSEDLPLKFDHNKNLINSTNDDQSNEALTDSESSETELTDGPLNYLNLNSFKKKPFSKLRSSLENISNISDKPNLHKSEKTVEENIDDLEVAEVHHENVDLDVSLNLADSASDSICSNQTTDTEDETSDNEVEKIILPPPPAKSSLSTHLKSGPKKNVLFRDENLIDSILTYGAAEYDRANAEIDPIASSAEWELEKRVDKMDVFSVDLQKDGKGLGLSIIGLGVGTETGVEKLGIFVKTLTENGASQKDGRIQVNDQILEVNGISLVGVTQQFAAQTLKNTSGTVRFLMGRDKSRRTNFAPGSPLADNPEIQHFIQDMNNVIQQMEEVEKRAITAESIVDEIKQELLKAEERAYAAEHELKETKEKLAAATESPFISGGRKLKNEIKLKKGTKNDKVEELQRNLKEANERLSASEESLLQLSSINRDKEIVELQLKIDENVAQLKSSAEVTASLQNEVNKKQVELDQSEKENQNLTELVEKLKTELEAERALFLEKESNYNEQSEKFEKFYNAKYQELFDKHQTLEKSVAIYENNHQKAKEKVKNFKQQLQDYEAAVTLVDTLKNELDDLKFKNTKQITEINELKIKIRELEDLSTIQNNKIEVLEEEVLESRNIREIISKSNMNQNKFHAANEVPPIMVLKKHEVDQQVVTEKKEDFGVDDFVLIEKEINSDEINSTQGLKISQHIINKIDILDKQQVSMKVVENEDDSKNVKKDNMGAASLSLHKSYETSTDDSTQLIILPENFDSLPEDNVDAGCNDEGQFLIIAEDVEDEMSFLSTTNNHMINTSDSEWKQINTDEKADEIAAMIIDRSPKKKLVPAESRDLSENSSSDDEVDSATNASDKVDFLDSSNNRRPSVKLDTSYLRKSMIVEDIDFNESVLDNENISLESTAKKNTQDNLLRSYSFSVIPKTSLLDIKYLHDKRTASNAKRKPSRGIQGLLASKVDESQDIEFKEKVSADSHIQNGSKPSQGIQWLLASDVDEPQDIEIISKVPTGSQIQNGLKQHFHATSTPDLFHLAEKPEKIKSNKFAFHIPKVFKKGKKGLSQSSLNLSPQSSNKLSPHSDVLIESKESITNATHNDANEPERANDSATDEEVVPFADKEMSMSVELTEKEDLKVTISSKINERAIDVDGGLDFKHEDESLPHGFRKDPFEWDVGQVGLYLVEMNLSQYVNSFKQHNVDGQAFLALKGSLLKELGVLNSEHRNEIKKKLKELRSTRDSFNKGKSRASKGKVSFWKGRYKVTN